MSRPSPRSRRPSHRPLVSFLVPAHHCPGALARNIPRLVQFADSSFPGQAEIILIPNPVPEDGATLSTARRLARRFPQVRVCQTTRFPGKGRALKEGFGLSRGRWIFTIDADIPYHLSFFLQAASLLRGGCGLVTGNRRLPESQFRMPVKVLKKAYGRFLLGFYLNRLLRLVLPLGTRDTQAGAKAMTRKLAAEVFRRMVSPHFMYDVEIFLTARALGVKRAEIPVQLHLKDEKSTVRLFLQLYRTPYWVCRILWRYWQGAYSRPVLPA